MCILYTRMYDLFHLLHSWLIFPFQSHGIQCVCGWDNREEIFIVVEGILRRQIEVLQLLADHYIWDYCIFPSSCVLSRTSLDVHYPEHSAFPGNCMPSWSNTYTRYQVRTLYWTDRKSIMMWGWYWLFLLLVQSQVCPALLCDSSSLLASSFHPSTGAANKGRWQDRQAEGWVSSISW